MDHTIIRLQPAQRDATAAMLARAFAADPLFVKVMPDHGRRLELTEADFRGVLTYVLRYGEVWTDAKGWGAACWLPPGRVKVTLWRVVRTGFALARGVLAYPASARRTLMRVYSRLDRVHAQLLPEPHWYLWVLGVDPDRQGHGVGTALLRPVLAQADAAGVPCYLETETERNVAFYRRRGFEVVKTEVFEELDLPMWLMVRRAAPASR